MVRLERWARHRAAHTHHVVRCGVQVLVVVVDFDKCAVAVAAGVVHCHQGDGCRFWASAGAAGEMEPH
jgi:hypothetical protein